ncbi:MAG: hypothetical protein QM740_18015 [Acidovorax sp.]
MSGIEPTWERLRATHWMAADNAMLRLGVYPAVDGMVALMFQTPGAATPKVLSVHPSDVPLLCKQLECAQGHAERQREINAEAAAAQMAFDLLMKAKEAAR